MRVNLSAILGGLLGGLLAAAVCWYATSRVLPAADLDYSPAEMTLAALVGAVGGVLGVVVGWLAHRRRARGLGGIAAIVSLLGALGATVGWAGVVGELDETGLFLVGSVLLLGIALVLLAAVDGLTVALLRPASRDEDASGWVDVPRR
jgi:hypothetical protein